MLHGEKQKIVIEFGFDKSGDYMNMNEFKKFMKQNNLNKVIRTNINYPSRIVDYTFANKKDRYGGKLSQQTFIGLKNKGNLKLINKKKINEYTFQYEYDFL